MERLWCFLRLHDYRWMVLHPWEPTRYEQACINCETRKKPMKCPNCGELVTSVEIVNTVGKVIRTLHDCFNCGANIRIESKERGRS